MHLRNPTRYKTTRSDSKRNRLRTCLRKTSRRQRTLRTERLEDRNLLAAEVILQSPDALYQPVDPVAAAEAIDSITTGAGDGELIIPPFQFVPTPTGDEVTTNLTQSTLQIQLDQFRADPRFAGIDGNGFATVVIDSGIDLDHPHFGPDLDSNGIADRIVHQQSFNGQATADDQNGHGTHVTATVASSDPTLMGMAPGADIISLQTQNAAGSGSFIHIEQALQWTVNNALAFNIASVNMSLGDSNNYTEAVMANRLSDEMAALAALNVIVVSASGNDYHVFNSDGVGYPSADTNSLSIGSKRTTLSSISGFSQRHPELTTVFAPGDPINAAWLNGGTRSIQGTSMASPHVAGIAVLAQQLAVQEIGRRLTMSEFETLVRSSGTDLATISTTGASYPSLDVLALGDAIIAMNGSTVDVSGMGITATSTMTRGQSGSTSVVVNNSGTTNSGAVDVDFFLSTNDTVSTTGDIHLGSVQVVDVAAGGSTTATLSNFSLPDPNDPFWTIATNYTIGAVIDADNLIGESNEANNLNVGDAVDKINVTILNPPSDLRGESFAISESSVFRGDTIAIDFEVENIGTGPAYPTEVQFFLSTDSNIDPLSDRLLGTDDLEVVLAGQSTGIRSISFDLPVNADSIWQTPGPYTIGMVIDALNSETESDEGNNSNRGLGLDLQSLQVVAPPTTVRGTVFYDEDGNGVRSEPYDEVFRISQTAGGFDVVRPSRVTTFNYENLPATSGPATLRVQARGDLEEVIEFGTVNIDGLVVANVFDKETLGPSGTPVIADETIVLDSSDWQAAMADGELDVSVTFTNPGSFSDSNTFWLRLTLEYEGESSHSHYASEVVENRVIHFLDTSVVLDATPPAAGDGTLTIVALGDVGGTEETVTIDVEGIATYELLDDSDGSGDLAGAVGSATIPLATLNSIIADGQLSALVDFGSAVDGFYPDTFFELRLDYPIAVERGVGGVTVNLDVNDDGTVDQQATSRFDDPATALDESGSYDFVDIGSGDFETAIVAPSGATQTAPVGGVHDVNLIIGELRENLDFGIDGPAVELSIDTNSISETGGVAVVTATLSEIASQNVTVALTTSGNATDGIDYQLTNPIVIQAGMLSASVSLNALHDIEDEVDEDVVIDIASVDGAIEASKQQVEVSILDDDVPINVSLSVDRTVIAEGTGEAIITATLSEAVAENVLVDLSYQGFASLSDDFTRDPSGTVTTPNFELTTNTVFNGSNALPVPLQLPSSGTVILDFKTAGVTSDGYILGHFNNGNRIYLFVSAAGDLHARLGTGDSEVIASGVDDDQWHQVALVYGTLAEVGQARVYLDGVLRGSVTNLAVTLNPASSFHLGAVTTPSGNGTQLHFVGEIRDMQAFGSVPSDFVGDNLLTIPAGQTTASVTIHAVEDSATESQEDIVVDIFAVTGAAEVGTQQITTSIVDQNHLPQLDVIADLSIFENAVQQTVSLIGISAGVDSPQPIRLSAQSDNPTLIDNVLVNYSSPDTTGSLTFTPEPNQVGTATITVEVEDAGNDLDFLTSEDNLSAQRTFVVTVDPVGAPTVEQVLINDGDNQRAQISQLSVTFDREVEHTPLATAFVVTNIDTSQVVTSLIVDTPVDTNGKTRVDLSFGSGPSVDDRMGSGPLGNSLADGNYRLDILAGQVMTAGSQQAMQTDYLFGGTLPGDPGDVDKFFRLLSDANGDENVGLLDFALFRQSFGTASGDSGFSEGFDNDGDGLISLLDFASFRQTFGSTR